MKIECPGGRNARQCYEGLQEACGELALPYHTVARWVKAFKEARQNVTDMPRPGHPAVREDVQTVNASVLADHNATIRELVNDAGLVSSTVLNILKKQLGIWKIASRLVPYDSVQTWSVMNAKMRPSYSGSLLLTRLRPELMNHS